MITKATTVAVVMAVLIGVLIMLAGMSIPSDQFIWGVSKAACSNTATYSSPFQTTGMIPDELAEIADANLLKPCVSLNALSKLLIAELSGSSTDCLGK